MKKPNRTSSPAPAVSVLMPVFDAERYVEEAVDSILDQSFRDFEFLIFDDGSSDRSPEILERARARDARIRLFLESHRGLTLWLCKGVAEARGEFIARMDADDVAHPERLARQVEYLRSHPQCVALGTQALLVDPERRAIKPLGVRLRHAEIDAELMRGRGDAMLHPTTMYRRDAVLAVGGYRPAFEAAEVLDLNLRLAEHGALANLPETLLEYRQHLMKVSTRRKGDQRRAQDAALREAHQRRGISTSAAPSRPPVPEQVPATDSWHRWASWAVEASHLATARRYAWALFRAEPFSWRACKLGLRALLGLRLKTARRLRRMLGADAEPPSTPLRPGFDSEPEAGPRSSGR
jgi:hypothetical protein